MHSYFSRKARSVFVAFFIVFLFSIFFQVYPSAFQESLTSYAASYAASIGKEIQSIGYSHSPIYSNPIGGGDLSHHASSGKIQEIDEPTTAVEILGNNPDPSPSALVSHGQADGDLDLAPSSLSNGGYTIEAFTGVQASPTPTPLTGAIVAAVSLAADLEWMSEISDSMWSLHRYNYDDPSPPPASSFPMNKGNEAMMYLSYVINNYDSLPDYSIFIHGHRESWHQEGDMVNIINNFQLQALEDAGYAPLRCDWYPSCPREIRPIHHDVIVWGPGVHREDTEIEIGKAWAALFVNETLPHTIASQCCAQFAVTRKAIQKRSKAEFERMRQWIIDTRLSNDVSGRVFEKLWAYIFTKESIRCPPPQQCACMFFGQCAQKSWPAPPEGLQKWPPEFDNY